MAVPFDKPLVCPVLVAREPHLAALAQVMREVGEGHGQSVLVAGEAGIGKTRLLAEVKSRAKDTGWRVLQGNCFEQDRSLPFAPVLDLLRSFRSGQLPGDLPDLLGESAPELIKLLPEFAAGSPDPAPAPAPDQEREKRRLFHTLTRLLTQLAETEPVLLVTEDLHWSDDSSLEFLLHLSRRIASQPIALLMTYRSEEVLPQLRHFLAGLDRERLAAELALGPLNAAEMEQMLRAIFGLDRPAQRGLVDALHTLTDGNPFFIEEVLRSLVATGDFEVGASWHRKGLEGVRVPRSVQDAVARRWETLSPAARSILELAAVAGQRFDVPLLQRVSGHDEGELLRIVGQLIETQLVVEESIDRFCFRHALTREAVYSQILTRERRVLHLRLADATERLYGGGRIEDLAYHFHEAGMWQEALVHSRRAGERAQTLYSPRAAVNHFTRALESAQRLSPTPPADLYRERGLAHAALGEFDEGSADLEDALRLARSAGDFHEEWQALIALGIQWASRDYARTGDYFRLALDLAQTLDEPAMRAHSLNRVGNWHVNVEDPLEGRRYHERALTIFRELGDQRGMAETLDLLGTASCLGTDLVGSAPHYAQAIELFRKLDDRDGLASSLAMQLSQHGSFHLDVTVPNPPDLIELVREGEVVVKAARETGSPGAEVFALFMVGKCLGIRGDSARSLDAGRRSLRIAEEIEHRQWMTAAHFLLGALHLDLLALPTARRHLERSLDFARKIGSFHWVGNSTGLLASTCIQQDDLGQAESVLDTAPSSQARARTLGEHILIRARAELALARGRPDLALGILDQLLAPGCGDQQPEQIGPVTAMRLRGEALANLKRDAEAERALCGARDDARAMGALPALWRIHLALGALYRRTRRDEAASEFRTAREIVARLAAGVPDEPLRDNFLREADRRIPSPTARQAAKQESGGLTEREIAVVRLIAQGKANLEIADALFVSKRTVETHIGNIFAKLGVSSRGQIATWTTKQRLLGDGE